MGYVGLVWLLILGGLMMVKPKLLWKIESSFLIKEGEPSKLYLSLTRACGVFLFLCSAVMLVYSLNNKIMG